MLFACGTVRAQFDGFGLRTQLPQWVFLSPGAGFDISWNGRYMVSAFGSYGDWDISHDTKWITISTVGVDVRRYFSDGVVNWANPNGKNYFGMYLGLAGRLFNFNNHLTSTHSQGNIWTVGPIVGYNFHLQGNWAIDASLGMGYCYDNYTRYKWYPPMETNRKTKEVKGSRFGLTDVSVAITYRFSIEN